MFIINNKIKIVSAVILAISTAATVLSSCSEKAPEIPAETVIGTNGEILGVSAYTEENESVTQTLFYEITTKKKSIFGKKENKKDDDAPSWAKSEATSQSGQVKSTDTSHQFREITSRGNSTYPQAETKEITRAASSFAENDEQTTKRTTVPYVPQSRKPRTTKKAVVETTKDTQQIYNTTKKAVSNEKINNESSGISIVFITSSVEKGNAASVMIQGEAGKKHSIDFYTSPTDTANLSELGDMTADENGFVTWTFNIPMNCESGNRKIIVKENGSDKYAQTSINVK